MTEGPNDWKWQVGLATHEWKAAEDPVFTGPGTEGTGVKPLFCGYQGAEPLMAKSAPKARLGRNS